MYNTYKKDLEQLKNLFGAKHHKLCIGNKCICRKELRKLHKIATLNQIAVIRKFVEEKKQTRMNGMDLVDVVNADNILTYLNEQEKLIKG